MGKRKSTPGPWSVFDRAETLEVQAKNGKAVIHWMGFDDTGFPSQNRANAHLIAAAPDMLEALEAAHSFIGDEYADAKSQALDGEHVSREARPVWHKICAALARGRDEGDTP